jgi:hypothetical protein
MMSKRSSLSLLLLFLPALSGCPLDPNQLPDGGFAVDGGGSDGGTPRIDAGPLAPDVTPVLAVSAVKPRGYLGMNDSTEIQAALEDSNTNTPLTGRPVNFTTSFGRLMRLDGGSPGTSLEEVVGEDGLARVRFMDTGAAGTATIRASALGLTEETVVEVTTLASIQPTGITCGGEPCAIMGLRNSGFNELSLVSFKVVDILGRPAAGVPVTFTINKAPVGTTVTSAAVTDAEGVAVASVRSGAHIGAFTVTAQVAGASLRANSNTVGVRGTIPSNNGFSFFCEKVNIPALVSNVMGQTNPLSVNCSVKLVDRFNFAVGTGHTVNLLTEAGTVEQSVTTAAFSPSGSNASEGTATAVFSTVGAFPVDVAPFGAASAVTQPFPFPRQAEPGDDDFTGGRRERNPRDGLVTLVAYARGEEFYFDRNANGAFDTGEQFIDQGEVFVDANDNNAWDPGETYVDDSPRDGQYNPANGQWDGDTTVWADTRLLYTDRPTADLPGRSYIYPAAEQPTPTFGGTCGSGLARGGKAYYAFAFADLNFNRPDATTAFATAVEGAPGRGSAAFFEDPGQLDGYGFGLERVKLDAVTNRVCDPDVARCKWSTLFYTWSEGVHGVVTVSNTTGPTANVPCLEVDATVSATLLGRTLKLLKPGAIE